MGTERAFQPGSYGVSSLWLLASFALSFLAALAGGRVSARVGRGQKAVSILAGLVVALGLTMAVPALLAPGDASTLERRGDMSSFEAMQKAQQPNWVSLTVPLVGAVGVLLGGRRS